MIQFIICNVEFHLVGTSCWTRRSFSRTQICKTIKTRWSDRALICNVNSNLSEHHVEHVELSHRYEKATTSYGWESSTCSTWCSDKVELTLQMINRIIKLHDLINEFLSFYKSASGRKEFKSNNTEVFIIIELMMNESPLSIHNMNSPICHQG